MEVGDAPKPVDIITFWEKMEYVLTSISFLIDNIACRVSDIFIHCLVAHTVHIEIDKQTLNRMKEKIKHINF